MSCYFIPLMQVCFIGKSRTYEVNNAEDTEKNIKALISRRSKSKYNHVESENEWTDNFTPREKIQKVRNCTQVDKRLSDSIIKKVFKALLDLESQESQSWNEGGLELPYVLVDKSHASFYPKPSCPVSN